MILPTKQVPAEQALLGIGTYLLRTLKHPRTISEAWEMVRAERAVGTFERFVLGLDMLYIAGIIDFRDGFLSIRPK